MTREEKYWLIHKIIDGILYKQCSKCKEWKPETLEFFYYKNKSYPEKGFSSECRMCAIKRTKNWIKKNYDYHSEYKKQWNKNKENYKKHKEVIDKIDEYHKTNQGILAVGESIVGKSQQVLANIKLDEILDPYMNKEIYNKKEK